MPFSTVAAPIDYIFAPELIPEVRTMFQRHIRNMNLESESESESQLFDVDVKVELHC